MVGIAVGLIVVAAATAFFLTNLRGSSNNIRQTRLNEDLSAAMDLMANDIRRAGYWGSAVSGTSNPFTAPTTDINIHLGGACILYSYDAVYLPSQTTGGAATAVVYGAVNDQDFFGFKLNGGVLQMRNGASAALDNAGDTTCTSGTWSDLTDSKNIVIDTLSYSFAGSKCLNTSVTPATTQTSTAGATTPPCTGYGSTGNILAESRVISMTLTGHHAQDVTLTKTLTSTVNVRNDRIVLVP